MTPLHAAPPRQGRLAPFRAAIDEQSDKERKVVAMVRGPAPPALARVAAPICSLHPLLSSKFRIPWSKGTCGSTQDSTGLGFRPWVVRSLFQHSSKIEQ